MPNGDSGGGFDLGSLLDFFLGSIIDAINAIIGFLQALVSTLVQALNFLLSGEQNIFGFSFASIEQVWQGIQKMMDRLWRGVILVALKRLWDLYQKIRVWAEKLRRWLDRFHQLQRQYQIQALRRIINLIQRARQILVIFRILHFKFAAKLDLWLQKIEGTITSHVFSLEKKTNEIITWIDLIFDPQALMRQLTLAQSLYRYIRGLRGVLGIPESRPNTSDEDTRNAQDRAMLTAQPHLEDPAVQRMLASLDAEGKAYFG